MLLFYMVNPSISGINIGEGDGILVALTGDRVRTGFGYIDCQYSKGL